MGIVYFGGYFFRGRFSFSLFSVWRILFFSQTQFVFPTPLLANYPSSFCFFFGKCKPFASSGARRRRRWEVIKSFMGNRRPSMQRSPQQSSILFPRRVSYPYYASYSFIMQTRPFRFAVVPYALSLFTLRFFPPSFLFLILFCQRC